jgi:hypothetical protein
MKAIQNIKEYYRFSISKEQEGGLFPILRNSFMRDKYECTEIGCP